MQTMISTRAATTVGGIDIQAIVASQPKPSLALVDVMNNARFVIG